MTDWVTLEWTAAGLVAMLPPSLTAAAKFWRRIARFAHRQMLAAICIGAIALLAGAMPSLLGHPPAPFVHDEFAHLLAADTFLHGRLTNPTPVMWQHFETFYELMTPTYMSIYPPAQGLAIAFGTLLHLPLLGSFGMVVLGCMATYWMLLPCLPARWAFLGGVLAATHPEIFNWGQGYWTGAVSMLGAALFCGTVTRLIAQPRRIAPRHGAIAGIGIALMANHRPFEGIVTILLTSAGACFAARDKRDFFRGVRRLVLPAAIVLLPVACWMGYYNWRVTGHITLLPYNLYERQYAVAPAFYWMRPNPIPVYRHEDLRELLVDFYYVSWLRLGTIHGFADRTMTLIHGILSEAFNPWLLTAPAVLGILPIGAVGGNRRRYLALGVFVSVGSVAIHLASCPYLAFHYVQSAVPMFIAWIVMSLRQLSGWRTNRWKIGSTLVIAVVAAQVAALCGMITVRIQRSTVPGQTRLRLVDQLNHQPGDQLVLVRYTPGSQLRTLFEWVYNAADPDHAKIVWARSMGPGKDRELLDYYHDRHVWLLDVDGTHLSFAPADNLR